MYINCELYKQDIHNIAITNIDWDSFKNKKICITGSTGLIGTFLVDLLMYRNEKFNNNITIYALSRNKDKALLRFKDYFNLSQFFYIQKDLQYTFDLDISIDYFIHGALNAHPLAYSTEPINTILTSMIGTKSILDYASSHQVTRIIYISSSEIYGINRGDVEFFSENYCGYLDCNTPRSCYPEGKRATETLCQAYIKEKKIDVIIARSCHVYGPTMGNDDSKVIAQFLRNAVNNNDIVIKSNGEQLFSYCYVADICSALLYMLLYGKNGEAYNISDNNYKLSIFNIANILSEYIGEKVIFENPSQIEISGYSKATKRLLDNTKLRELGWKPLYPIKEGLIRTVEILRQIKRTDIE